MDISKSEYVFLHYMERGLALNGMDQRLVYVCLRCGITKKEYHRDVAEEEFNNTTGLNVSALFIIGPFSAAYGVIHAVRDNYGSSSLKRLCSSRLMSFTELDSTEMIC